MKQKEFESYLNDLYFLKSEVDKLEYSTNEKELYIIDEISKFIIQNKKYSYIKTFVKLSDVLVEFIENYNKGNITVNNIKEYYLSLKNVLSNFENELKNKYQINIYYYGKDKYGLINNKLNKYPIKQIVTEKQLNIIASKHNSAKNNSYNILFVNESVSCKNNYFDEILNYNQITLAIKNANQILYKGNYDYHYIKTSLNKVKYDDSITNIIVGNSYPLVGIDNNILGEDTINLSMSSQDLYYSFKLAKESILSNNIKTCIFGISYYLLKHDLSMGESAYSRNMIKYLYNPLLKDIHNCKDKDMPQIDNLNTLGVDILLKTIFDLEKVESHFDSILYEKNNTYYNEQLNPRNKTFIWSNLSIEQKNEYGKYRADQHNKLYQYENTKKEYTKLLDEFIEFLHSNNVELKCVVFPTTKYYEDNISTEFKNEFAEIIDNLKAKNIKVIDLRLKNEFFTDEDFADADHLNDLGAVKATNFIKQEL